MGDSQRDRQQFVINVATGRAIEAKTVSSGGVYQNARAKLPHVPITVLAFACRRAVTGIDTHSRALGMSREHLVEASAIDVPAGSMHVANEIAMHQSRIAPH